MAITYSVTKLTLTVNGTSEALDVSDGRVTFSVTPSNAEKTITAITATVVKDEDGSTSSISSPTVTYDNTKSAAAPQSVTVTFTDTVDGETITVTRTVKYVPELLIKMIQESYYAKLWAGYGAPEDDGLLDPVARDEDGFPQKVTPKLGWFYIDSSTGEFYTYSGLEWVDTGEKWIGGFI